MFPGVPLSIISDPGTLLTFMLWTNVHDELDKLITFIIAFHPRKWATIKDCTSYRGEVESLFN